MSGKSIAKISRELSEFMNVGLYNATRLIRTEVNHFANESEMLAYEELEIDKYKLLLNNSRDPFKDYFSIYDLRSILNTNIDYTISQNMYLKDMENYVMNGKILTLEPKAASVFSKDFNTLMTAALDLMGSVEDGQD